MKLARVLIFVVALFAMSVQAQFINRQNFLDATSRSGEPVGEAYFLSEEYEADILKEIEKHVIEPCLSTILHKMLSPGKGYSRNSYLKKAAEAWDDFEEGKFYLLELIKPWRDKSMRIGIYEVCVKENC